MLSILLLFELHDHLVLSLLLLLLFFDLAVFIIQDNLLSPVPLCHFLALDPRGVLISALVDVL